MNAAEQLRCNWFSLCSSIRRSPESSTRIWNLSYDLDMEFEWDKSKATANLTKHDVSFEEAKTVFDNVLAVIFDDEAHSVGEKREIIIGHSRNNRLLLISFTERSNTIRIISARLATRREREDYEQNAF
ncbi:BrnT family toxin [Nostoc sp. PCC 9305]|uniref:BrnT family toxin n=1 Tax=Nostoc sp. PCC 9305 TaxID=296636 RepID=UPI0039C65841